MSGSMKGNEQLRSHIIQGNFELVFSQLEKQGIDLAEEKEVVRKWQARMATLMQAGKSFAPAEYEQMNEALDGVTRRLLALISVDHGREVLKSRQIG